MNFFYKYSGQFAIVTVIMGSLTGCLVGPDFHSPPPPKIKHYTECPHSTRTVSAKGKAGKAQYFIAKKEVPPQWWHLFHSEKLNCMVCRGLANSPNLKAAKAALHQAQENYYAGIGGLFPAFTGQLSAQRGSSAGYFSSNSSTNTVSGSNVPTGNVFTLLNANVNVSYVLDVFGGVRRGIEALKAQMDYQDFEWKAAYLSLTGNIVTSAIALASFETQIKITKQLICEQEEQLRIIKKQFVLGGASGEAVLAQRTQVAQTRATLPPLEKGWEQTRHALAMLMGTFPSASRIPSLYLGELHLPTRLPVSIPSRLVRHRPDIRAAEELWRAANAQIGVATANLFPQFNITGTYGKEKTLGAGSFLSSQTNLWSIGGYVLQPIFRGGTLIAQRRAAIAAAEQAAAQYQEVVLQAFQNVADTLRALEADARELRENKRAEVASRINLQLVRQQFNLGGVSYLSVLDAERQYQQTRISLTQAQASRFADTAALFQALGGGWWNC
jgi:NodT family efflux transporter outer membrane factor (OMF) lipoprotein